MTSFQLTTGEWITLIGVVVAVIFGLIQVIKKKGSNKQPLNINQKAGAFSKSEQSISVNTGNKERK
jgi:hypothetical protein